MTLNADRAMNRPKRRGKGFGTDWVTWFLHRLRAGCGGYADKAQVGVLAWLTGAGRSWLRRHAGVRVRFVAVPQAYRERTGNDKKSAVLQAIW